MLKRINEERRRIKAAINSKEVYEVCSSCNTEVKLKAELEIQECPECREAIKPCSLCFDCISPCIYDEVLECNNCSIEGTWNGGSANGNMYECEVCGEISCLTCLEKHGQIYDGDHIICTHCMDLLKEYKISKGYEELINKSKTINNLSQLITEINKGNVRIFNDKYEYKDWMYDTDSSRINLLETILEYKKDDISDDSTILDDLISHEDRATKLSDGKVLFHFND